MKIEANSGVGARIVATILDGGEHASVPRQTPLQWCMEHALDHERSLLHDVYAGP